jgi:LacI family transcriptional regulator
VRDVLLAGISRAGLDGQMLRGINSYRHAAGPWLMHDAGHDRGMFDELLGKRDRYDGVFANVTDDAFAQRLAGLAFPVVDLSGLARRPEIPVVTADNVAVGRQAASYLLNRGFMRFVYHSTADRLYERQRWQGFIDRLRAADRTAVWVRSADRTVRNPDGSDAGLAPRQSLWLQQIDKPVAVFAASDGVGANVCDKAHAEGFAVPEQVAVLGVDNARMICESCYPTLSSVRLPGEQIGYAAARLLHTLMLGQSARSPVPLAPLGIEQRQSTAFAAVDDPLVAKAVAYMRDHCRQRLSITEVAGRCGVNRRTLEKHFRSQLDRSPLDELFRLRVEIAQQRLLQTDASIYETAIDAGFRDPESMATHFKRRLEMTPTAFRRSGRVG